MNKLHAYLVVLPRWFAAPFFAISLLLGAVLAGGITLHSWIAFIAGMALMAAGHSWNSYLDWAVGLDRGEEAERSAEKDYTGGQSLIAKGICSPREVMIVSIAYDAVGIGLAFWLSTFTGWPLVVVALIAAFVPFMYTWGKFNLFHETALAIGVGPVAVLMGMFATSASPPWMDGLIVSVPIAVILSYLGLALDEYPDWQQNVAKGCKSISYRVSQYGVSLEWYCGTWLVAVFIYQVLLISIGELKPFTALTFLTFPPLMMLLVVLKRAQNTICMVTGGSIKDLDDYWTRRSKGERDFAKTMKLLVGVAALYPLLLLVGQIWG